MILREPLWLLTLLALVPLTWIYLRRQKQLAFRVPSTLVLKSLPRSRWAFFAPRTICFTLCGARLYRTSFGQTNDREAPPEVDSEGLDIVLVSIPRAA